MTKPISDLQALVLLREGKITKEQYDALWAERDARIKETLTVAGRLCTCGAVLDEDGVCMDCIAAAENAASHPFEV